MMSKSNSNTQIIRTVLTVKERKYLTPHYIRITLTGDDVALFANCTIGANNKIFIPPYSVKEVHFPDFDREKGEWIHPSIELSPIVRTYTHRGIDLEKKEIWIDFVAHGDEGPASSWAINAKKGDQLGVAMKQSRNELYPDTDWYLLAGDATAIPVLSSILEQLPAEAKGYCIIEVHGKEDEQFILSKSAVQIKWLYNPHPENGSNLTDAVKNINFPSSNRFAYIAAEFSSVKNIRTYLRKEMSWKQGELYAYSYWKAGLAEDKSTNDRREEKESQH